LCIDRKFVTEGILKNIEDAEKIQNHAVALKGYSMLAEMYDLNEDKINDRSRFISEKDKLALVENFKSRLLDVTPE
jgi:hypothetical protein